MSKFSSVMNLIKEKPGMYLGKKSFTMLYGFITGFSYAEEDNKLEDHSTLFPLPFWFFHEFVKVKLGYYESTSGWYNMIFEKNNYDEDFSVDVFFQLYDEFNNLKIQSCISAILSEENKHFHIHDPSTPKRLTGSDENGNPLYEPYFSDPEQIFLIKMPNGLGYLRVITTKKTCFLVFKFSNHEKESTEYFHRFFGENLSWKKDEWKNELLNNKELTWT
ncbi:hypothetical protein [Paenibacillus polymyxa]|uniref:hypothetical protein n=1 Tax=Paenibacillus polymyxa TaxID=1406 RepID=UPI0005CE77F3|nr:hypothetical protein [Paenibacillus polymyxa]KJD39619.1 hypothetical protein QD46_13440 [Paenibacillus polymyxa]MDU8673777.1 hypothetical protein [Paenibacillus polymyxa]MDU8698684.1 hypothetical protein [Paenibacillus polymyxa]URJ53375.1 hypothetical protein MF623_002592 [Paenibacillus polymyxa]URJ65227.1 hypothetical protein MF620_004974 [Paenibacillus polymyxa]